MGSIAFSRQQLIQGIAHIAEVFSQETLTKEELHEILLKARETVTDDLSKEHTWRDRISDSLSCIYPWNSDEPHSDEEYYRQTLDRERTITMTLRTDRHAKANQLQKVMLERDAALAELRELRKLLEQTKQVQSQAVSLENDDEIDINVPGLTNEVRKLIHVRHATGKGFDDPAQIVDTLLPELLRAFDHVRQVARNWKISAVEFYETNRKREKMLDDIGETFACFSDSIHICDDGTRSLQILRAKLPQVAKELVDTLRRFREEARQRNLSHVYPSIPVPDKWEIESPDSRRSREQLPSVDVMISSGEFDEAHMRRELFMGLYSDTRTDALPDQSRIDDLYDEARLLAEAFTHREKLHLAAERQKNRDKGK